MGARRPPAAIRLLLALFPESFRDDYGRELASTLAARRRDAVSLPARVWFWMEAIPELLWSAGAAQLALLGRDARQALRTLRRSPAFAATVIAVAALGIGATTAVVSMADHVLLRPLPFRDAERLVNVWEDQSARGYGRLEPSPANFRDWREQSHSFEALAAYANVSLNLVGQGAPERLDGAAVTADLLPALGIRPLFGRSFTPADDRPGAPRTAILGYGLWQSIFGGRPDAVGRTVRLDDAEVTVIGVMPRDFAYPTRDTEVWTPLGLGGDDFGDRNNNYLHVVGRLAPGVSIAAAQAEMTEVAHRLALAYPKENEKTGASVLDLRSAVPWQSRLLLGALLVAAAFLLAIACLNLANLLFARAVARRREIALRTALGAGRARLVRQLLSESALLAGLGGVLGVPVAFAAMPILARLVPQSLPIRELPGLDLRVLSVAAIATAVTVLAFGLVPALRACRAVDAEALREGTRSAVAGRRDRLRAVLVIGEVTATVALLVLTGLLLRSMWRVQSTDPGFRADHVLTLRTALPQPRYAKTAERVRFYDRVLGEIRALPGVEGAGYVSFLPMVMRGGIWSIDIPGIVTHDNPAAAVSLRYVTPGFFGTLGIPLRAGRDVAPADGPAALAVAVVSASFAERHWPGLDPLGRRFTVAGLDRTVVGVVGDVKVRGLERESEPQVYLPSAQVGDGDFIWYAPKDLAVRTSGDPLAIASAVRAILARVDPELPVSDVRPLSAVVEAETGSRRAQLAVLGGFAALAVLLAGIGIHGLLAFGVARRTSEIGVRLALGARRRDVLGRIVGEAAVLAACGGALGVALAYAAARGLGALLFGVAPGDPATYATGAVLTLAMTALGTALPALRAVRIDPARALRTE